MNKSLSGFAFCVFLLAGCATGEPASMLLHQATTTRLGLASTDEVTIANIHKAPADLLGGSKVTYDATTAKGRKFACSTLMMPSINPLEKPQYSNIECAPK